MKIVSYVRVSTAKQGASGLGLEAQRAAIESYRAGKGATLIAEFNEIESGKNNERPALAKALHRAKVTGATLVIAKLDRLSRNAAFLLTLRDSGAKFVAADMPEANSLTIGILAVVAQQEREAISRRTIEALAAAKARGITLGNPNGARALLRSKRFRGASLGAIKAKADQRARDLRPVVDDIRSQGLCSVGEIARELTARGMLTARGETTWRKSSTHALLARLDRIGAAAE